jgi:hypothetical protein
VGHNNKGRQPGWLLQGVELADLARGVRFAWHAAPCWLDSEHGCSRVYDAARAQQGALEQQQQQQQQQQPLRAATAPRPQQPAACGYQLEVQTSSVEGAGTNANVFVQLGGELCEGPAVQLKAADEAGAAAGGGASRPG